MAQRLERNLEPWICNQCNYYPLKSQQSIFRVEGGKEIVWSCPYCHFKNISPIELQNEKKFPTEATSIYFSSSLTQSIDNKVKSTLIMIECGPYLEEELYRLPQYRNHIPEFLKDVQEMVVESDILSQYNNLKACHLRRRMKGKFNWQHFQKRRTVTNMQYILWALSHHIGYQPFKIILYILRNNEPEVCYEYSLNEDHSQRKMKEWLLKLCHNNFQHSKPLTPSDLQAKKIRIYGQTPLKVQGKSQIKGYFYKCEVQSTSQVKLPSRHIDGTVVTNFWSGRRNQTGWVFVFDQSRNIVRLKIDDQSIFKICQQLSHQKNSQLEQQLKSQLIEVISLHILTKFQLYKLDAQLWYNNQKIMFLHTFCWQQIFDELFWTLDERPKVRAREQIAQGYLAPQYDPDDYISL